MASCCALHRGLRQLVPPLLTGYSVASSVEQLLYLQKQQRTVKLHLHCSTQPMLLPLVGKEWYVFFAELLGTAILGFAIANATREVQDRVAAAFTAGLGIFIALMVAVSAASYVGASRSSTLRLRLHSKLTAGLTCSHSLSTRSPQLSVRLLDSYSTIYTAVETLSFNLRNTKYPARWSGVFYLCLFIAAYAPIL